MISIVRLINIQSYKDITFDFTEEVNVLEAPNETGKSVMFKVFRIMCDANWFGRGERKSIIRNGCEFGTTLIVVPYSGGTFKIMFKIYKTFQLYYLFDGNEQLNSWKQDTIPDEIRDILSWYYDKDSKILLNLCDQELDMPFVNSNARFNYEVMKFIIENPELEMSRFNIGNWMRTLFEDLESIKVKEMTLKDMVAQGEYVDTVSLEESINKRNMSLEVSTALCDLLESLTGLGSLSKPKDIVLVDNIDIIIDRVNGLRSLGVTLQDVFKLEKPSVSLIDVELVENSINSCKVLNRMRYSLSELMNAIDIKCEMERNLTVVRKKVSDFEMQHEVCPLCGSTFGECSH